MTENEAKQIVLGRFIDNWTGTDLAEVAIPNGGAFTPPTDAPWIRLTILETVSRQHTMGKAGSRQFERSDLLIAQVFTPKGTGTKVSDALIQELRDIFEGAEDQGVIFYDTQQLQGADANYYQINLNVKFKYHETR